MPDVTMDDDSLPKVLWDDRKYRSVATIIYMAKGMLDLQFAYEEACRDLSPQTVQSWKKVKRGCVDVPLKRQSPQFEGVH